MGLPKYASISISVPRLSELRSRHEQFDQTEPTTKIKYGAVTASINAAFADLNCVDVGTAAEAVGEWLRYFNTPYHSVFNRPATSRTSIEPLISAELKSLLEMRGRSLASLKAADEPKVLRVFATFQNKLGPIGAAKALHPLAPGFFAMWDNDIAAAYGVAASPRGYFVFLCFVRKQIASLRLRIAFAGLLRMWRPEVAAIKMLDEYNFMTLKTHLAAGHS